MIKATKLEYQLPNKRRILKGLDFELKRGEFLAVLGENGAGKTTLLDLLMGFRRRTGGDLTVMDSDPERDPWQIRQRIAYLSEKIDIPGDWEARELLDFHRFFYQRYDASTEKDLTAFFGIDAEERIGNLSAGEIRRVQILAALASEPELVIADEITAVLDILGRRKFLKLLKEKQINHGMTVVLATNVPEGLDAYADRLLLLHRGEQIAFAKTNEFLNGSRELADAVARRLES